MAYQDLKYLPGIASVIITTHNDSRYIGDCIKSLVEKTKIPLEIIVCDDSTVPDVWQHIIQFAQQAAITAHDLKLIHSCTHTTVGHMNNYGRSLSRGEYVFFANDDIKMMSESWAERMIKAAELKPDGGVFGLVGTNTYRVQNVSQNYNAETYVGNMKESPTVAGILTHIPRPILDSIGMWDENLTNYCWLDVDWAIRVRAHNLKCYICQDVFVHHLRIAPSNIRQNQQERFAAKYSVPRIKNESDLVACIQPCRKIYGI